MNPKFEIKIAKDRVHWYFVLVAPNGKVIATSQLYDSKQACRKGIRSVKWNALIAYTDDLSV